MALKTEGPLTAAALGKRLGITGEAARQQLVRLAEQGLVVASSEAGGVGRPRQSWQLAAAAQSRFPDTHAGLTAEIIGIVRAHMGEAALDTIIALREAEIRTRYRRELARKPTMRERVAALAALRSAEGYMASWSEAADGSCLLVENHCPIRTAATACAGFCRSELTVFRAALGPGIAIERTTHLLEDGRPCTYRIRATGH